jgi:hypothetical protein
MRELSEKALKTWVLALTFRKRHPPGSWSISHPRIHTNHCPAHLHSQFAKQQPVPLL